VAPRCARLVPTSVGDLLILVLFRRQDYVLRVSGTHAVGGLLLSVLRFIPIGVFDDATVRNIGGAFDLACKELNDAGQPDVVHEVMIKRIIAAARRGERDLKRLRDAGLTGLRKPNHQIVDEGDSDERGDFPQIASKHPEFWNPKR
jgi:hypothetical protein